MTADTLIRCATVLTGDPSSLRARTVALCDGRVAALDGAAEALRGAGTEVVEVPGSCLVPGFGDGHIHPLQGGCELAEAPVAGATSVAEVAERVRAYGAAHPELTWLTGGGYDPALSPGGLFDARDLDAAVPDRPVLLYASDHHNAWVNTAALRSAGIDASTPDPARGAIARRADGTPLGTLLESAVELVAHLVPPRTFQQRCAGLRLALAELAAAGVTGVQEAALHPDDLAVYLRLEELGELTCRVDVALLTDPESWRDQLEPFAAARTAAAASALVRVRTVKFFVDGVIENGTAALLEPYADAPGSYGVLNWPAAELAAAVAAFDAVGFSPHLHAIGDAAVRVALDAVQEAARRNGPRDRRPVVAHTQLVHPDDVPRFAALGVVANLEPLWAQPDPIMVELTVPRLGPERAARQYAMRDLLDAGATVSFGSDWPVSSLRPLEGIATAVTRQTPAGEPPGGWEPGQRLSLDEALAAYTSGVAAQLGAGDVVGTIAPGRRADLALLGADICAVPASELATVPVLGTWLGGVRVHRG